MRSRPDHRAVRLTALVMLLCAAQVLCASAAVAAEVSLVAVVRSAADDEVCLLVDVEPVGPTRIPPESFSVTAGGVRQLAHTVPVIRDRMPLALVVDASAADAPALRAGLSGAASLLLQAPSTSRFAVIANTTPPMLVTAPGVTATDALSALSAINSRGDRSTSEALGMALRALPGRPEDPSVIVLHTSAPDAGGEPVDHLAARLAQAHALLTVVTTSADTAYWAQVTSATGGTLVATRPQGTIEGFDRAADTMRARYMLTFPVPDHLPARVAVQIRDSAETLTVDATVPNSSLTVADPDNDRWVWQVALAVWILGIALLMVVRRLRDEDAQFEGGPPVQTRR
jgi:hypothetical protein